LRKRAKMVLGNRRSCIRMRSYCLGLYPEVGERQVQRSYQKEMEAEHQWLMPVILATQKAEIRRITVQSQPGQIVCKILSQKRWSDKV
jgi:hypothetical protein